MNNRAKESQARGEKAHSHNGDWLECSDCGGTGIFVVYEQLIHPPVHVFLNSLRHA